MFLEKLISEMAEFGRIFWTADKLQQKLKTNKRVKERSSVEESVVFTFPYQTNGNHATKPSTVGHVILRTVLGRYLQFQWNCKQLQVEVRNSMPNYEIYFPIFSETVHTNLKIFSQNGLRKCRERLIGC